MLGHSGSHYYTRSLKEQCSLWKKIEPSLTYLDQTDLEARHKDMENKLETMERENRELRNKQKLDADRTAKLQERIDRLEDMWSKYLER
jgi:hypothetical protein